MTSKIVVDVMGVSKKYASSSIGIKEVFLNILKKKNRDLQDIKWVLKDASFKVKKGSAFCIAGPNGTGKSTLLSLIQGIIKPDYGFITTHGKIVAMNELGGGFHPDLTGRDNIFVNGTILGNKIKFLKKNFDQIVEFSGLEKSIEEPLRTYSNGMIARLAFSVIAYTEASIILIDEVITVGDEEFRKKCINHFKKFKKNGGTIILVSHDLGIMSSFCDEGIYISSQKVNPPEKINDLIDKYIRN